MIDDLVLGIDEACANVVCHSESPSVEIALGFRQNDLYVDVSDRGKGFDVSSFDPKARPDVTTIGGRGLFIMAKICDDLTLRYDNGIKVRMVKKGVLRRQSASYESALEAVQTPGDLDYREARRRAFLEEIDEAFVALDWEYRCTYANRAAERLSGLPRKALLGHRPWDLLPELAGTPLEVCCREAMELGEPSTVEQRSVVTGTWLEARVYPTSAGISVYLREIAERKRVETERGQLVEQLTHSEERFRTTFERATVGIAHAALDGRITRVNSPLCAILGRSREELELLSLQELVAGCENGAQEPGLVESLREGRRPSVSLDHCLMRKGSEILWTSVTVSLVRDKQGEPGYFVAVVEDITERHLAAAALKQSERRFRLVTENVSDVIWVIDGAATRFAYMSPSVSSLCGYTPEEVMARDIAEVITPGSLERLRAVLPQRRRAFLDGQRRSHIDEIELTRKDGTTVWTETTTRFVANHGSGELEVCGTSRDITERKALGDALERERDVLATVMATATAQVAYLDRDLTFLMVNPAFAAASGYEPEEMVGLNYFDLHPDEENEAVFRHVRDTGVPVEYVAKPLELPEKPERSLTYWDWRLSPVRGPGGDVRALVFSRADVTERVRRAQYAEALTRILEDISASLDPGEIVGRLAGHTGTLLRADGWSVFERAGEQWLETHVHRHELAHGASTIGAETQLAATAVRERRVVVAPVAPDAPAGSTLVAPLLPGNGPSGALCFTWQHAHRFSEAEIDFVARLTAAAAPMLANARLFHRQRHVARTLPEYLGHPLPEIRGLEVGFVAETAPEAALSGGDFSDVFELGDGRVLVLVGDVSGSGVAAAGVARGRDGARRRAGVRHHRSVALLHPEPHQRHAASPFPGQRFRHGGAAANRPSFWRRGLRQCRSPSRPARGRRQPVHRCAGGHASRRRPHQLHRSRPQAADRRSGGALHRRRDRSESRGRGVRQRASHQHRVRAAGSARAGHRRWPARCHPAVRRSSHRRPPSAGAAIAAVSTRRQPSARASTPRYRPSHPRTHWKSFYMTRCQVAGDTSADYALAGPRFHRDGRHHGTTSIESVLHASRSSRLT